MKVRPSVIFRAAGFSLVVGLCSSRGASGQLVLPSQIAAPVDWTWGYEANLLPNTAGAIESPLGSPAAVFTRNGNAFTSEWVNGGVYQASTIDTNGTTTYHTPSSSSLTSLNSDRGYTFEWRARVDSIDAVEVGNSIALGVDEARLGVNRFWILSFLKNSEGQYRASLQGNQSVATVSSPITAGVFNSYRVTVKQNTATLYVNNSHVGRVSSLRNLGTNRIEFGDFTGSADSAFAVDYLRVYHGAAIAPVENLIDLETYIEPGSNRRFRTAFSLPGIPDAGSGYLGERMWYQVSTNNGATYDTIRPLVQSGDGYNVSHPIAPVYAGLNDFRTSEWIPPTRMSNGKIIVPFQYSLLNTAGTDYYNPFNATTYTHSGVMVAQWNASNTDIEWRMGGTVAIDPNLSTRGLLEPAIVETNTPGRLLMVMRGSNQNNTSAPARSWKTVSTDYGETWSTVSAMTYSDGMPFFSPSGMSDVRMHSVNDRIYWFGNIVGSNANGNSPRYPLVLGRVDEPSLGIVPGSVRTIANYTPGAPFFDTPQVEFSNFTVTEDSATHNYFVRFTRVDFGKPRSQWASMSVSVPIPIGPEWRVDSSGNWGASTNWSETIPNGIGATADFLNVTAAPRTIYTDSGVTLGWLRFENSNSYQLTGQGSLSMNVPSGSATIQVGTGTHKINLPLYIQKDTNVSVAAGAMLKISDPLVLVDGSSLTKSGAGTLAIEAPVSSLAPATLAVASGQVDALVDLGDQTTLQLTGGTASLQARQHLAAIDVSGGILQMDAIDSLVVTPSLKLSGGGQVDLRNGTMIVDYSYASPLPSIKAAIDGGRVFVSQPIAGEAIGIGEASDLFTSLPAIFAGERLDATCVLIIHTIVGDANLDRVVDSADFGLLVSGYGVFHAARWTQGNFNDDTRVDSLDFNLLAGQFGHSFTGVTTLGSVIPEPASAITMLAALSLGLRTRRGSRRS